MHSRVAQRQPFPSPKMRDDYSTRQAAKDKEYAQAFDDPETQKWVASMTREERAQAEKLGLLKPLLPKHGAGAPGHDMAESKLARIEAPSPDSLDPMPPPPTVEPGRNLRRALQVHLRSALPDKCAPHHRVPRPRMRHDDHGGRIDDFHRQATQRYPRRSFASLR